MHNLLDLTKGTCPCYYNVSPGLVEVHRGGLLGIAAMA